MISRQEIAKQIQSLPTLPAVVINLHRLLQDEYASAADFEAIIKPDPALTANLLQLANSSWAGTRSKVATVRDAITTMGLRKVFEVATSASFVKVIPPSIPGYELDSAAFWLHCSATAILAEELGNETLDKTPEMAFTAGLLHDIGKLAIGVFLESHGDEVRHTMRRDARSFMEAEQAVLGTDHTMVGETVAKQWKLPEEIVLVNRWHHHPSQANLGDHQALIDLVHIADGMAHSLGYGADIGCMARKIDSGARKRLKVDNSTLERVAAKALTEIMEFKKAMSPRALTPRY